VGQVDSLGLTGSVRFLDQGISQADLAAHYRAADCFVSCSEHEGFCVPLLEAMHHHLPIVAFRSSAIPETLGGAGIVLDTKEPLRLAAAAASVIGDRDLRSRLDRLAQLRLAEMSLISGRRRLSQVIVEHFDFSERDRVIAELLAEPVEGGESAHSGSSA
jgi:glycosyltransferase involved in cell wall biosynthesis